MNPTPTGRLVRTPEGRDLVITRTFRAPIEDVWASITEPERTARWFGPWSGEAGPGKTIRYTMAFEEGGPEMESIILGVVLGRLGNGARRLELGDDPLDIAFGKRRHVFAKIHRQVGQPIRLVACQCAAGYGGKDVGPERIELHTISAHFLLVSPEDLPHLLSGPVIDEIEGAVFTDHAVHGPHAGDMVAPAGGTTGHRHHCNSGIPQPVQCTIGIRPQLAIAGNGIVDIRQQDTGVLQGGWCEFRECLHGNVPAPIMSICRLSRQSLSTG
jgi:hypothetical protein